MTAPMRQTQFTQAVNPACLENFILPHDLPHALDRFPQARVLSLDCFDTLLWRDCFAPGHLFWTLPDVTPLQRERGEALARKAAMAGQRGQDVPIADIYAQIMPNATHTQRAAAIEAELAAEARHCYGFSPTIALMREAKARGLQIIIVSDTYLDPPQLRQLIARAAGEDVAALIDKVFCSSTYGKPKSGGLYGEVLRKLKAKPDEILHIGDKAKADVAGVAPFGVHTLHLRQFHETIEQQLRLESVISGMLQGQNVGKLAAPQPHRPAIAATGPQITDAGEHVGYATLGPILTGFDQWLRQEAEALQTARGGKVHWLFLLRDGWLPMRLHEQLGADAPCHPIEISRFTSTTATFVTNPAITNYVEANIGTMPDIIARQLRLSEAEIATLTDGYPPLEGTLNLLAHLRKEPSRKAIRRAARDMGERIAEHVRAMVQPNAGDTLMLIDLGYNGSVQNNIDAMLAEALKVHVAGRYLILRPTEVTGLDKKAYFGEDDYDFTALNAMCTNVAVIEQLCTTPIGSVIGYEASGEPIRKANDIKQKQSEVRDAVQAGVLRFAAEHAQWAVHPGDLHGQDSADRMDLWRRANAATLTRLLYLPLDYELDVFESFEHDVNLGTDETLALFEPETARRGLRQQGMFYQKGARRMYMPAELAHEGMATRLTHFAASRFALGLTCADFAADGVNVPVIYADDKETVQTGFRATATHDGYYALCIPIADSKFTAAVQFGAVFEWVEVFSISAMPSAEFLNGKHDTAEREVKLEPILDGITDVAPNLWHCHDKAGFACIQPPLRRDDEKMLLVVVFRPVVTRADPAILTDD